MKHAGLTVLRDAATDAYVLRFNPQGGDDAIETLIAELQSALEVRRVFREHNKEQSVVTKVIIG